MQNHGDSPQLLLECIDCILKSRAVGHIAGRISITNPVLLQFAEIVGYFISRTAWDTLRERRCADQSERSTGLPRERRGQFKGNALGAAGHEQDTRQTCCTERWR